MGEDDILITDSDSKSVNQLISEEAVYRTAPATPGLLERRRKMELECTSSGLILDDVISESEMF